MAKKDTVSNTSNKATTKKSMNNNKQSFIEKHAFKLVILIAIIGLIIRLYRIGFLSLWVDEYMHALAAINGKFKHGENNGILLTWFNTIFAFVLGNTEFSMRFPVAILGSALILTVYVLAKNLLNYKLGLMSALLVTFSLYLIFWSRVDRPYGMVATFYIPLLLCLWLMLEKNNSNSSSFWNKIGINKKYFLLLIPAFILSMMSQLICFLFIFTAGFYGTFNAVESWFKKTSNPLKLNGYNILFYLNIIAIVLMFTPLSNMMMRPIIEVFLPPNIATLILPDMKAVNIAFQGEKWLQSFDKYVNVADADFNFVPILGWFGFVLALIKDRKVGYFLVSSFVIPVLLMGFVFREPAHAKYLSYIYPIFLISAAYTLYFVAFYFIKFVNKNYNTNNSTYKTICNVSFILLLIAFAKTKEIKGMLETEVHGNVVPPEISEIHFVNWNQPCEYIKNSLKPGDIIMSTVQEAPKFYFKADSVVWFRQMHFDAKEKKYVPNKPDLRKNSAYTFEQLVKTYENNARGWLLADYYFDNALTDPKAKQFVEENFTYHFDGNSDGAVKVFSWDKANPKKYQSAFVYDLGKSDIQQASKDLYITMSNVGTQPKYTVSVISQGIDSEVEAFLIINDKEQIAIKPNGKPSEVGMNVFQVDAKAFKNGENKLVFAYNNDDSNGDLNRGFVVYNMNIQ